MARSRGYAQLEEAHRWRRPHRSWLRTAKLNVVGWSALLGLCLLTTAAGVAVMAAVGLPRPFGAAGAILPLIVVVVVDRRRWARMESDIAWGGSVEEVSTIAAALAARGVHTWVRTLDATDEWGEPVSPGSAGPVEQSAALAYLNRDVRAVTEVLRAHGIRAPDLR